MNLRKRFHYIFALIVLIPLTSMVASFTIAWVSWNNRLDTSGELEAPRYLHSVLLDILTGEYEEGPMAEKGIIFLLDHNGDVLYAHPGLIKAFPNILDKGWTDSGQEMYSFLMEEMPIVPFSMVVYRYKEKAGIAVFVQELVSKHTQAANLAFKLVWIFYLGFILLPVLSMSFFIRPMSRTIIDLEEAAGEIGKGNWDVELTQTSLSNKRNHPFAHLIRSFDQMRRELKDNHDRQHRIMMSISHDLKTPLTSIKGYVEAIQDGMAQDPEELDRYMNIIMEKSHLLEERISDLIHFSRLQTTEWQSRFTEVNLHELLSEAGEIFKNDALIRKRNLDLQIEISEDRIIKGDRKMLFQVLENLFDNACRYTDGDDTIRFTAKPLKEKILISMEDSGPGIKEEHQSHIFDNFYRADSSRNTRGIGVGLASSKTIIQSHGGKIYYSRTNLGGACFLIELPFHS